MSMDSDFDGSLAPSETIYACRAIRLDPANEFAGYLGQRNSMCVGISPQASQDAPGLINNNSYPYVLAGTGTNDAKQFSYYGEGRKCLWDVDSDFGGQIRPNTLLVSYDLGLCRPAATTGSYNQWIVAIALTFASGGQSCNVLVKIFPWLPTGS